MYTHSIELEAPGIETHDHIWRRLSGPGMLGVRDRRSRAYRHRNDGMALFVVVLVMLLVMAGLTFIVGQAVTAKHQADRTLAQFTAEETGKAGIEFAIEKLWGGYRDSIAPDNPSVASFLDYLDRLDPIRSGQGIPLLPESGLRIAGLDGEQREVVGLELLRQTVPGGVRLSFRSTAQVGPYPPVTVEQIVAVSGQPLEHPKYAVFSKNVSCVMCHAEFRSLPLEMNRDPQNFNTFPRVKIGSLESILIRSGQGPFAAHSRVAGTVYSRGDNILKENHAPYTQAELAHSSFRGFEISPANQGMIMQDQFGQMHDVPLITARTSEEGVAPFANLYLSYASVEEEMPDGMLPTNFPAPYPDRNGNRLVEDDEFREGVVTAQGSLSGGVIVGVPRGGRYDLPPEQGLPPAGNEASLERFFDGHAVLVGQPDNPLVIQDEVAINGDIVIRGAVRGWGRLSARGNIYIVGDLTYDDAGDSFGAGPDGSPNGLALVAGGNILVGDYLTRRAKTNEDEGPGWRDLFIDMRREHQPVAPGRGHDGPDKDIGYFGEAVVDPGRALLTGEGYMEDNMSFSTSAISQFNQRELNALRNAADGAGAPRFYTLRDGAPIYAYAGHTREALGYTMFYNNPFLEAIDPHGSFFNDRGIVPAIVSLGPEGGWISEDQLRQFWFEDELARPDDGAPLRLDALLYSTNAILGLVRSKDLHNSNTYGQMIVRGAFNAPDLALLVPGANRHAVPRDGLKMLYDPRVVDFRLTDPNTVLFRRTLFRYGVAPQPDRE
jgi:hypothetical protein